MLAITKEEIRQYLTDAAMREQNTLRGAATKLTEICRPDWKLVKGKSVAGPSLVECFVDKVYTDIYTDPYAK